MHLAAESPLRSPPRMGAGVPPPRMSFLELGDRAGSLFANMNMQSFKMFGTAGAGAGDAGGAGMGRSERGGLLSLDWGKSSRAAGAGIFGGASIRNMPDSPTGPGASITAGGASTRGMLGSSRGADRRDNGNGSTRFSFDFNKSFSMHAPLSFRGGGFSRGSSTRGGAAALGMSSAGAGSARGPSSKPMRAKSVMGSAGYGHL